MPAHFPSRLRMLRLQHGLTQEQMSERAEVSLKHLQRLESGSNMNPSLLLLVRLAAAINVPLYELLYSPKDLLVELLERSDF